MVTRVSVHNYCSTIQDDFDHNSNNNNHNNYHNVDAYIHHDSPPEIGTINRVDRDEGSNTIDLDESYNNPLRNPNIGVEDDRSSLESSGSLRNLCDGLTTKDILPIETARVRFLQIIVDHFISEHLIERRGAFIDDNNESGVDQMNKRKSGEILYEGDPRFALPLMYVANLYETLVNEVNPKMASLIGVREKTIGVSLEASGGLYRKLTQKFPKSGSYSFKRRELATSMETRRRFPELVVQEQKRIRFVVINGLNIIEKPNTVPPEDAEWFKRLTGRVELAVTDADYKFYNPRHKVRRASLNASPTLSGLLSYHGSSDHEFQSASENPGDEVTPSKQHLVTIACQPHYQPVPLNHLPSLRHTQSATLISCSHESGHSSHLHDISPAHESPTLSQNMASVDPLAGSHVIGRLNMMPSNLAKFCDECGSSYVRPTSKFCSQCGTKRFGI